MCRRNRFIFTFTAIFLLFLPFCFSEQDVQINGFINDYANIISPEQKLQIEEILNGLYNDKIAEFSIVTITSLEGKDIESYALSLAQGKLGDKEKNNGLLLLVSLQDRKYRFEVGRGIEPILNDAKVGRIGRTYLVENFRNEDYGKGIYEAALAVDKALRVEKEPTVEVDFSRSSVQALLINLIILAFIVLVFILPIVSAVKQYSKKRDKNKAFDAAMIAALLFGGPRGGFGGGGSGSGGFGGFGGGSFGGGGSSGGW